MSDSMYAFVRLDLVPLAAAVLSAVMCALLGNFLLLRKLSLMGDAISHSVLPGLVVAFLLTDTRAPLAMFVGAAGAGILTVIIVEVIKRIGRVESGAAMGVTFSILFALGVLLIEQAAARQVDLDADCVLHGQVETLAWIGAPRDPAAYLKLDTYRGILNAATGEYENGLPIQVVTLLVITMVSAAFIVVCFKELRIATFDAGLATTLGFSAGAIHIVLMVLVAAATVAAFEAVGSILVIGMLICPAATARLLTDRLRTQVALSALIGLATGSIGYIAGAWLPEYLPTPLSINVSGAITVVAAFLLIVAILLSPSHGIVARLVRRKRLAVRTQLEDLLGLLYRRSEESHDAGLPRSALESAVARMHGHQRAIRRAESRDLIRLTRERIFLTERGGIEAASLVRRHRLWEDYLVQRAGVRPDHVHETAETLEHLLDLQRSPIEPKQIHSTDPHGKIIPPRVPEPTDPSKRSS